MALLFCRLSHFWWCESALWPIRALNRTNLQQNINGIYIISDINECASDITNPCQYSSLCGNTIGGFTCDCPPDFELQMDEKTCKRKYQ